MEGGRAREKRKPIDDRSEAPGIPSNLRTGREATPMSRLAPRRKALEHGENLPQTSSAQVSGKRTPKVRTEIHSGQAALR